MINLWSALSPSLATNSLPLTIFSFSGVVTKPWPWSELGTCSKISLHTLELRCLGWKFVKPFVLCPMLPLLTRRFCAFTVGSAPTYNHWSRSIRFLGLWTLLTRSWPEICYGLIRLTSTKDGLKMIEESAYHLVQTWLAPLSGPMTYLWFVEPMKFLTTVSNSFQTKGWLQFVLYPNTATSLTMQLPLWW